MLTTMRFQIMQFLQFFVWGTWLYTFGAYSFNTLHLTGSQIGAIYGSFGIASLFMPAIIGVLADKYFNKERIYAILHIIGGVTLFATAQTTDYRWIYIFMLLNSFCFMASIPLGYSIIYTVIEKEGKSAVNQFPLIRVWGTIGIVLAMWVISLSKLELSSIQLVIGGVLGVVLGFYSFTLPKCPPEVSIDKKNNWSSRLGLDALVLFKKPKVVIFMIFSILLGGILQISNVWTDPFLHSFAQNPLYHDTLGVKYPAIIFSLSQMSETVFILLIPFFLRRYGIKAVILMSLSAWVIRYSLFSIGNPGDGLWLLLIAMVVYGCAFDFFNLSGSLFIELESKPEIRASAQGLFMIMVNGFGAMLGGFGSGALLDRYSVNGVPLWANFWQILALCSLVMLILFWIVFRYKHNNQQIKEQIMLQHQ